MTIIAVPSSVRFAQVAWDLDQPAQVNRSEWTKRRQVVDQPGPALWSATADLVVFIGELAALLAEAFIVDLEGQRNSFRLRACERAQTPSIAAVVVNGAGQSGRTLHLRGGETNRGLRRGHKMTVNDQLIMVMADFAFDPAGHATVTFKPSLRAAPADGDAVEMRWPTALVSLTGSSVGWSASPGQLYQVKQLALEEAF